MDFRIDKLIDVLVLLAKKNQELDRLRVNKLLYFIDKEYLREYGKPILNDIYKRLPLGAIPDRTNDFLKLLIKTIRTKKNDDYFDVGKNCKGHDALVLKREKKLNLLNNSEIEAIENVIKRIGKLRTDKLVDLAHKDKTWTDVKANNIVPYEFFLDGLDNDKKNFILELMEIDRENREFSKELTK